MISVVISSYQPKYFTALEKNIAETVGIPYEIIKIDNPGLMGICEAYNKGALQAAYPFLLFLHEDVEFVTTDWGKILVEVLSTQNIGVVGLAGSNYVPNVPSPFWAITENNFLHIIQLNGQESVHTFELIEDKAVFSLDGVFLGVTKLVFEEFKFSKSLHGFHGYDLDFSIRVASKYINLVTSKISAKHFSTGNANKEWLENVILARNFYKIPSSQKTIVKNEIKAYDDFLNYLIKFKFSKSRIVFLAIKYLNPIKLRFWGAKFAISRIKNIISHYHE
ncbi:glycosyltransferase family protein [Chryseobacterium taklimakanense]|uniref:glycosyltransferase n=1 Tax=Chryseobacterium taklimakanense TaxID=536441 RepID=UPI001EF69093|nr:glycosyltransferase [Chryseobacterium taklimakanense]MCG7281481.1 glycosyltransferase family protein [Chryseobacterium taklimakanense]